MRPPPGGMRPGLSPSGQMGPPRSPGGMMMQGQQHQNSPTSSSSYNSMNSPQSSFQQLQQPSIGMLSSSPQQGHMMAQQGQHGMSSNLLGSGSPGMMGQGPTSPLPQGDLDLDLSHLTPLERAKIQSVMNKANQEVTSPIPMTSYSSPQQAQSSLLGRSPLHNRM